MTAGHAEQKFKCDKSRLDKRLKKPTRSKKNPKKILLKSKNSPSQRKEMKETFSSWKQK